MSIQIYGKGCGTRPQRRKITFYDKLRGMGQDLK